MHLYVHCLMTMSTTGCNNHAYGVCLSAVDVLAYVSIERGTGFFCVLLDKLSMTVGHKPHHRIHRAM